jgi:hypothetical protein
VRPLLLCAVLVVVVSPAAAPSAAATSRAALTLSKTKAPPARDWPRPSKGPAMARTRKPQFKSLSEAILAKDVAEAALKLHPVAGATPTTIASAQIYIVERRSHGVMVLSRGIDVWTQSDSRP